MLLEQPFSTVFFFLFFFKFFLLTSTTLLLLLLGLHNHQPGQYIRVLMQGTDATIHLRCLFDQLMK
jgi:hypothetical protein